MIIRCTVGAASKKLVGVVFGQLLLNFVAVDQMGLGLGADLGRAYPSGKCFKFPVDNSIHRARFFCFFQLPTCFFQLKQITGFVSANSRVCLL